MVDRYIHIHQVLFSCLFFSRVLLKAIGSNIFNTIVDQVPYAIEDLQREIRQNAELDSGEESESQQDTEEMKTTSLSESSQKTPGARGNEYKRNGDTLF